MRKIVFLAGLLIIAVTLTGCFSFAGSRYSSYGLKVGKKTVATIDSHAPFKGNRAYELIVLGLPTDGSVKLAKKLRYDLQGNFGGPFTMKRDDALRDQIVDSLEYCLPFYLEGDLYNVFVYRTQQTVKSKRKRGHGRIARTKATLKQVHPIDIMGTFVWPMLTATGAWIDENGDGNQDLPGEAAFCTGGAATVIKLQGVPVKPRAQGGGSIIDQAQDLIGSLAKD